MTEGNSRIQIAERHVGRLIRERRLMLGLTLQQLADAIGVSYQQAQKNELGINRVSAGRLYEIARFMNVPVNTFFEGLDEQGAGAQPAALNRAALEVAGVFSKLSDPKQQDAVVQLIRAMGPRS